MNIIPQTVLTISMLLMLVGCAAPNVKKWDSPDKWRTEYQKPLEPKVAMQLGNEPTLHQAITLAMERNPMLLAERQQWLAAIQRIPQAHTPPDPMLSGGYQFESVETRVGPQEGNIGISQPIPWPQKLWARGKTAEKQAAIAQIRYETAIRDTVIDIKDSWYELYYLDQAIPITEQITSQLHNQGLLAYGELNSGRTQLGEAFRAESQAAQLEYDLILLHENRAAQAERMKSLLNLPPDTIIGPITNAPIYPVSDNLNDFYERGSAYSQMLKIRGLEIQRAQYNEFLARLSRIPDVSLGVNKIFTGDALMPGVLDSGKDPLIGMVSMNLPIWENRNRALIKEKKALEEASVAMALNELNTTRRAIATAYFQSTVTERLFDLYNDTLIPQADSVMQQAELDFRADAGSYSNVLESTLAYHNFLLARNRALADHGQAIGRLEKAIGTTAEQTLPKTEVNK